MKTFINSNEVHIGQELSSLIEANEPPIIKVSQTTVEALNFNLDKSNLNPEYLLRFSNEFGSFNVGNFSISELRSISRWGLTFNNNLFINKI